MTLSDRLLLFGIGALAVAGALVAVPLGVALVGLGALTLAWLTADDTDDDSVNDEGTATHGSNVSQ